MGMSEQGEGAERKGFCLPSPHPLPLPLIFSTRYQFLSPSRAFFGKGKETATTQANHELESRSIMD